MLGASIQYALGNEWGPFAPSSEPGKVLMLYGEEDKEDVHDRVQALRHSFMLTDEQIELVASRVAVLPLRGSAVELAKQGAENEIVMTEQLARLEARISEYGVKLVVMDPLALLHSLEESDNHAIAAFVSGLDAVCMRTGTSIILVHHFGKGGVMTAREVNESNVRGASALVAHARTVVVMHRLRRDEAQSWGVQEDDHARWVMWNVAKNNYGRPGQIAWFEVSPINGAITPSATQLQYLNTRDIREAARAHTDEVNDQEITATAARVARDAAEKLIEITACKRVMLRWCKANGKMPKVRDTGQLLRENGFPNSTDRRGRETLEILRNDELVHPDGLLTEKGEEWLLGQEWLAGVEP
jgi:RecA-family ATPase